jgi:rRNA biogenesis protein RRP5
VGDRVKALILSVENRRISLTLKPSYFTEEDFHMDGGDMTSESVDVAFDNTLDNANNVMDADKADSSSEAQSSSDDDDISEQDVDPASIDFFRSPPSTQESNSATTSLNVAGGFQWLASHPADEGFNASSSEDDEEHSPEKKKKKKKTIEMDLTEDMHSRTPQSNADYERLLLGSPNSSYLGYNICPSSFKYQR